MGNLWGARKPGLLQFVQALMHHSSLPGICQGTGQAILGKYIITDGSFTTVDEAQPSENS